MIAYEKLEVYQLSLDCVELCVGTAQTVPKGYSELSTQLKRAIFSVSLNIAEGAGKSGFCDKKRFYEIAKGSAMESAAVLDILHRLKFIEDEKYRKLKGLLHRVISMLSKLCFNLAQRDTENGGRPRPRKTATD